MSYAIRNTLILLVTLFLIAGGGFGYYKFYLEGRIASLEQELEIKKRDFTSKQNINNEFNRVNGTYMAALEIIENYDKTLFPSSKSDDVYDFLNEINNDGGDRIFFAGCASSAARRQATPTRTISRPRS
jgi:hypothetical protein